MPTKSQDASKYQVYMDAQVHLQAIQSFKWIYGNDYKLSWTMDTYLIPRIKNGETTHWEALTHCINKDIPLIVRSNALGTDFAKGRFIMFGGYDSLTKNNTTIRIWNYDRNRLSFNIPVDLLELDLNFRYRDLVSVIPLPL